jgi:uncharacterized protein
VIVDFRARPNLQAYAEYLFPRLDAIDAMTGGQYGSYRAPVDTVDGFVERLDKAGIDIAVFAARSRVASGPWGLTNDLVARSVEQHRKRLVGLGGIDIADTGAATDEIRRCARDLGMPGVCFDPFQRGVAADDRELDVLYDTCQSLGIMAVVTLGGMPGVPATLDCGNPVAIDRVAHRFPDLVIVASHAGWPYSQEMVAVAWRRPNVYFENSFYHLAPGAQTIVQGANQMVGRKVLYASAYPFSPLEVTLTDFQGLQWDPGVRDDVLGGNALRVLERCGWGS